MVCIINIDTVSNALMRPTGDKRLKFGSFYWLIRRHRCGHWRINATIVGVATPHRPHLHQHLTSDSSARIQGYVFMINIDGRLQSGTDPVQSRLVFITSFDKPVGYQSNMNRIHWAVHIDNWLDSIAFNRIPLDSIGFHWIAQLNTLWTDMGHQIWWQFNIGHQGRFSIRFRAWIGWRECATTRHEYRRFIKVNQKNPIHRQLFHDRCGNIVCIHWTVWLGWLFI